MKTRNKVERLAPLSAKVAQLPRFVYTIQKLIDDICVSFRAQELYFSVVAEDDVGIHLHRGAIA